MKKLINRVLIALAFSALTFGTIVLINHVLKAQIEAEKEILSLKGLNETMSTLITSQGRKIAQQDQHIFTLDEARKAGLITIEELKMNNLKSATTIIRLENKIKRLELELSYTTKPEVIYDTIYVKDTSYVASYLRVPLGFKFNDPWTDISGVVKTTGVTIDSISMLSKGTIMMGYSRGYFRKSKPIISYADENPYVTTTSMQNVVIVQQPPFYKRPMWYRMEGALASYLVIRGAQRVINQ